MNQRLVQSILLSFSVAFAAGCQGTGRVRTPRDAQALLFDGMGNHHRAVTTTSRLAQRYFDQGLTWAYAFNHDEAIRSFSEAARIDPGLAMAHWGVAFCHGPHINNVEMPPEKSKAAWDALQRAIALKENASPVERELIDALTNRYAYPAPEDRKQLDQAFADAMGRLWAKYPTDPDIGTLYAESLMNLRPWDLWTQDGRPQPGTLRIVEVIENVLHLDPNNPGANHLMIHAVEASPDPEQALLAAGRLDTLVPGSGHLLHMPSHIYVLTGRWPQAAKQNQRAIAADRKYRRQVPRQGFYRLYMAHNQHMLSFVSMMEGREDAALSNARDMIAAIPEEDARNMAVLIDPVMTAPYDALKRFGRWDELLREPAPPEYFKYSTAMWRFSRGVAYAAKGQIREAEAEQAAFRRDVSDVPADQIAFINLARDLLAIGDHMLVGEIALAKKDYEAAVYALRKAVELEDRLLYMEPPEWVQPVRHTLGAVLVADARYDEAERVYREDLKKWPGNGWSLFGLEKALRGQGRTAEADQAQSQFKKAWARADTRIGSSCLCVKAG